MYKNICQSALSEPLKTTNRAQFACIYFFSPPTNSPRARAKHLPTRTIRPMPSSLSFPSVASAASAALSLGPVSRDYLQTAEAYVPQPLRALGVRLLDPSSLSPDTASLATQRVIASTVCVAVVVAVAMSWWWGPSSPSPADGLSAWLPGGFGLPRSWQTTPTSDLDDRCRGVNKDKAPDVYGYGNGGPPQDDMSRPDVIIVTLQNQDFRVFFPSYAISDGTVSVRDVKEKVAIRLGVADIGRIKLLYKGKQLKEDAVPLKQAGLKQQSHVMCVVMEPEDINDPSGNYLHQSSPASRNQSSKHLQTGGTGQLQPHPHESEGPISRNPSTKSAKSNKCRKGHKKQGPPPSSHQEQAPTTMSPAPAPVPAPRQQGASTGPAQATAGSSGQESETSVTKASMQPPRITGARSPEDKLKVLNDHFYGIVRPLCRDYIEHTPAEQKVREYEHKKLNEITLNHIIINTDGVDTEGNPGLRQQRKALVKAVQDEMGEVDRVSRR